MHSWWSGFAFVGAVNRLGLAVLVEVDLLGEPIHHVIFKRCRCAVKFEIADFNFSTFKILGARYWIFGINNVEKLISKLLRAFCNALSVCGTEFFINEAVNSKKYTISYI